MVLHRGWLHYQGADKSLARPGRKQDTERKILIFLHPIYNHNWRDINAIYIYIYIYILISCFHRAFLKSITFICRLMHLIV